MPAKKQPPTSSKKTLKKSNC